MIMMIPWIMYTVKYLLKMNEDYPYFITNHNFIKFKPVALPMPDSGVSHKYIYLLKKCGLSKRYLISLPLFF